LGSEAMYMKHNILGKRWGEEKQEESKSVVETSPLIPNCATEDQE